MREAFDITNKNISYNSVDDKNLMLLIDAVRNGVKFKTFATIASKSPFTYNEWSHFLNLSERTFQRYKEGNKSFGITHSEKIFEIYLLNKMGVDVFGDKDKFNSWLQTKNLALGGVIPKTLLDTKFGIELLKDELTRIEYGVLA